MSATINEKLDRLYVCSDCKASFLFQSDVEEHKERARHASYFEIKLEDESGS